MIALLSATVTVLALTGPHANEDASFLERKAAMDPFSRKFLRPNDDLRPLPAIGGVEPQRVSFAGVDGVTLRGALYDHPATKRAVVICLGIRGNHTYLLPYQPVEQVLRAPSASEELRNEEDMRRISMERYLEHVRRAFTLSAAGRTPARFSTGCEWCEPEFLRFVRGPRRRRRRCSSPEYPRDALRDL